MFTIPSRLSLIVFLQLLFVVFLLSSACSHTKPTTYQKDPSPKFSNEHFFSEKPMHLRLIAKKVLEDWIQESSESTHQAVKIENAGSKLSSGWVYEISRDKYLLMDFNGVPTRKKLRVRRNYMYSIHPAIQGSQVTVDVEEEIENLDKKTGENKGWKKENASPELFQRMFQTLKEKVRSSYMDYPTQSNSSE